MCKNFIMRSMAERVLSEQGWRSGQPEDFAASFSVNVGFWDSIGARRSIAWAIHREACLWAPEPRQRYKLTAPYARIGTKT
jgi:hypothetical protein